MSYGQATHPEAKAKIGSNTPLSVCAGPQLVAVTVSDEYDVTLWDIDGDLRSEPCLAARLRPLPPLGTHFLHWRRAREWPKCSNPTWTERHTLHLNSTVTTGASLTDRPPTPGIPGARPPRATVDPATNTVLVAHERPLLSVVQIVPGGLLAAQCVAGPSFPFHSLLHLHEGMPTQLEYPGN